MQVKFSLRFFDLTAKFSAEVFCLCEFLKMLPSCYS
jgi:hypothetical protein